MKTPKVLFVGSFINKSKDLTTGGQTFACISLINSSLSQTVDWIKLDTTASTNKKRNPISIVSKAIIRIFIYIYKILFYNPDYVLLFAAHSWSFREKSFMAWIAKFLNKKVVFAPRSGLIKNNVLNNPPFERTITKALDNADYLICQSKSWKDFYTLYNENKTLKFKIINNWLTLDFYQKMKIKHTSQIESKDFKVLFLGSITRNKGVFDLVKAIELTKDKSIKLFMGGNGDAYEELSKYILDNSLESNITLLNWLHGEDKFKYLVQCDVFILPSYQEGYPNAILEAIACGLPIIATNIESISDIIKHKVNGYLVTPGNHQEIIDGVKWYKDNPKIRNEISSNALRKLKTKNSINKAVSEFEEIFSM